MFFKDHLELKLLGGKDIPDISPANLVNFGPITVKLICQDKGAIIVWSASFALSTVYIFVFNGR